MSEAPKTSLSPQDLNKLRDFLLDNVQRGLAQNTPRMGSRRETIQDLLEKAYAQTKLQLDSDLRKQIFGDIADTLHGYGPLQPLLDDESVTEIMVNSHRNVFVERAGKLIRTDIQFRDENHLMQVIQNIVQPLGRRIGEDSPSVDARLPDGSRVNAIIPPVAIDGASVTIRKFSKERLGVPALINFGSLTDTMAQFLEACVRARLNIVISGGTGSGKTTLLNILSSFIPERERIVTIEDAAELQIQQEHVVRLETVPPKEDGSGGMPVRALVRNALRMRPDRIVIGEVRGGEALDMLQAMNTGHDGSLTTLHANTPRDAISRLETMVLMAGMDLPAASARQQIASAIDLIVQQSRLTDGSRKVTYISEVSGMEGDIVVMSDIFRFVQTNITPDGQVIGDMKATGIRPLFMSRLEAAGFNLGAKVFMTPR
jgi:pilus assembly protein CpaF